MPPPPPRSRVVLAVAAAVAAILLAVAASRAASQTTAAVQVDPDSWVAARRELWGGGGYISYDAMSRGRVPCSYRGASYYNCRPGGAANPYSRGCSQITRCRG